MYSAFGAMMIAGEREREERVALRRQLLHLVAPALVPYASDISDDRPIIASPCMLTRCVDVKVRFRELCPAFYRALFTARLSWAPADAPRPTAGSAPGPLRKLEVLLPSHPQPRTDTHAHATTRTDRTRPTRTSHTCHASQALHAAPFGDRSRVHTQHFARSGFNTHAQHQVRGGFSFF
jgi:hypothetical protein